MTLGVLMLACQGILGPQPLKCSDPNQQALKWVLPWVDPTDSPLVVQVLSQMSWVYLLVRFHAGEVVVRYVPLSTSVADLLLILGSSLPSIWSFIVSSGSPELPVPGKVSSFNDAGK